MRGMGFAVRVRSAGQKYGPTCHQRDHADVTEFVTLVRLSSLGQHVGILALAGYKRRKSTLTAGPIGIHVFGIVRYGNILGPRVGVGPDATVSNSYIPVSNLHWQNGKSAATFLAHAPDGSFMQSVKDDDGEHEPD